MDLDFWGCFGRKQTLSYNQVNTVCYQLYLFLHSDHPSTWRPEYAAYMVEGTPGKPYGGLMAHFNLVEANMKLRYMYIKSHRNFVVNKLH